MAASPDNRQGLIDAGRRLFLTAGYAGTSIDAICQEAGVSKGAFFHHFKSKKDFASAVLADTWEPVVAAHREEPANKDAGQALGEHIRFMVDWICDSGRLMPMLAQELGPTHPGVARQVRGYFETWMSLLVERLDSAGSASTDVEAIKDFVVATTEGVPIARAQFGDQAVSNVADNLVTAVLTLLDS